MNITENAVHAGPYRELSNWWVSIV